MASVKGIARATPYDAEGAAWLVLLLLLIVLAFAFGPYGGFWYF
ncbi:hypothetical protein [Paenibacillus sp.]|nr:hypothetical protein [Paenibacillus sp.]HZG84344.1 hypothetical protein [Paenibacillus sp.]